MGKRYMLLGLVCVLGLAMAPARAHGDTQYAGSAAGLLSATTPTFAFTGDAAFAGRISGQPAAAKYVCSGSGPNAGYTPNGGPFEGTFTCIATLAHGAAPIVATGTFKGWSNTLVVTMQGSFDPGGHRLNCEGGLVPVPRTNLTLTFAVSLNCLVE